MAASKLTRFAVLVILCGLAGGAAPLTSTAAPSVAVATNEDYASFRKLAGPLRVIDLVSALNANQANHDEVITKHSAKWQSVYKDASEHAIRARSESITDSVMSYALTSFSHDEIARLTIICANPSVSRYQDAKVEDILNGDSGFSRAQEMFLADTDVQAFSRGDLKLLVRLLSAVDDGIAADRDDLGPVINNAFAAANAVAKY